MAKKKPSKNNESVSPKPADNKVRLELRLDKNIVEELQRTAQATSISTNQLVQGILRWAAEKVRLGEAYRDENGLLHCRHQLGCVWFGNVSREMTEIEKEHEFFEAHHEERAPDLSPHKGDFYFSLDFTERRIIQEEI